MKKFQPQFLIIFCLVFLISSCSHHVRRDGPPNFYVDENKIPNATPKPERLSKYGNLPSYRVAGVRYYTMKSCNNYEAYGVASWYGTMFHKRNTSSGEPYDMLRMTAAHKTLPLPTYVEVVNLKNHKQIIVKVNDRGPFAENRIIDLSYVAAKKLGMLGHGTAPVRIRAINPYTFGKVEHFKIAPPHIKPTTVFAYHKNHPKKSLNLKTLPPVYLQVGAFKNKLTAEKFRYKVSKELAAPVQITNHKTPEKIFRVQVGPLKDQLTANKISLRLKRLGIKVQKTGV